MLKEQQMGPDGKPWIRKQRRMTLALYDRDIELMTWLTEYLGSSYSDVMRTAIRSLAAQLAQIPEKNLPN